MFRIRSRVANRLPVSALLCASTVALTVAGAGSMGESTQAQGLVVVTGVSVNHSSAKVFYNPVPGAKDYRIYDVTKPNAVKYAGQIRLTPHQNCPGWTCFFHFAVQSDGTTPVFPYQVLSGATGGPQHLDVAATQMEYNDLGDNQPHTLVIEALDALGPVPPGSLYSGMGNTPFLSTQPAGSMLGANKGATVDGKTSTNGQGPYTSNPQVIARSQPFVVRANTDQKAIPSKSSATQTFFDTFENAEGPTIRLISRTDSTSDAFGNLGSMRYTMNSGTPKAWELEFRRTDNINSMPFIGADHFMDMVFDGATPGVPAPTHTLYASMAMTPVQTVDMSGGKILHLTMEVDAHQSFRRWMNFALAPASDPLQNWDPFGFSMNNANQAAFFELTDGGCSFDMFTGPNPSQGQSPTGPRIWGGGGNTGCGWDQTFILKNLTKNGRGLDDRSRFDLFVSQTHAALFQDGQLITQGDIPAGSFPWANGLVKVYYSHYLYHSDDEKLIYLPGVEVNGQKFCYPLNSYFFNDPIAGTAADKTICNIAYPPGYGFPNSDERHWDNMGFEVLPSSEAPSNNYSSLAALVQEPAIQPPQFGGGTPPGAPTNLRIVRDMMDWFLVEPRPSFADDRRRVNGVRPSNVKQIAPSAVVDDPICPAPVRTLTAARPALPDQALRRM